MPPKKITDEDIKRSKETDWNSIINNKSEITEDNLLGTALPMSYIRKIVPKIRNGDHDINRLVNEMWNDREQDLEKARNRSRSRAEQLKQDRERSAGISPTDRIEPIRALRDPPPVSSPRKTGNKNRKQVDVEVKRENEDIGKENEPKSEDIRTDSSLSSDSGESANSLINDQILWAEKPNETPIESFLMKIRGNTEETKLNRLYLISSDTLKKTHPDYKLGERFLENALIRVNNYIKNNKDPNNPLLKPAKWFSNYAENELYIMYYDREIEKLYNKMYQEENKGERENILAEIKEYESVQDELRNNEIRLKPLTKAQVRILVDGKTAVSTKVKEPKQRAMELLPESFHQFMDINEADEFRFDGPLPNVDKNAVLENVFEGKPITDDLLRGKLTEIQGSMFLKYLPISADIVGTYLGENLVSKEKLRSIKSILNALRKDILETDLQNQNAVKESVFKVLEINYILNRSILEPVYGEKLFQAFDNNDLFFNPSDVLYAYSNQFSRDSDGGVIGALYYADKISDVASKLDYYYDKEYDDTPLQDEEDVYIPPREDIFYSPLRDEDGKLVINKDTKWPAFETVRYKNRYSLENDSHLTVSDVNRIIKLFNNVQNGVHFKSGAINRYVNPPGVLFVKEGEEGEEGEDKEEGSVFSEKAFSETKKKERKENRNINIQDSVFDESFENESNEKIVYELSDEVITALSLLLSSMNINVPVEELKNHEKLANYITGIAQNLGDVFQTFKTNKDEIGRLLERGTQQEAEMNQMRTEYEQNMRAMYEQGVKLAQEANAAVSDRDNQLKQLKGHIEQLQNNLNNVREEADNERDQKERASNALEVLKGRTQALLDQHRALNEALTRERERNEELSNLVHQRDRELNVGRERYDDILRNYEINLGQLEELNVLLEQQRNNNVDLETINAELRGLLDDNNKVIENYEQVVDDLNVQIDNKDVIASDMRIDLQGYEREVGRLQEIIDNGEKLNKSLIGRLERSNEENEQLKERVTYSHDRFNRLYDIYYKLKSDVEKKKDNDAQRSLFMSVVSLMDSINILDNVSQNMDPNPAHYRKSSQLGDMPEGNNLEGEKSSSSYTYTYDDSEDSGPPDDGNGGNAPNKGDGGNAPNKGDGGGPPGGGNAPNRGNGRGPPGGGGSDGDSSSSGNWGGDIGLSISSESANLNNDDPVKVYDYGIVVPADMQDFRNSLIQARHLVKEILRYYGGFGRELTGRMIKTALNELKTRYAANRRMDELRVANAEKIKVLQYQHSFAMDKAKMEKDMVNLRHRNKIELENLRFGHKQDNEVITSRLRRETVRDRLSAESENRERSISFDDSMNVARGERMLDVKRVLNENVGNLIGKLMGNPDPSLVAYGRNLLLEYLQSLVKLSDEELKVHDVQKIIKMFDDGQVDRVLNVVATKGQNDVNNTLSKRMADLENTVRGFINMTSQRTAHIGHLQAYHPPRRVFVGRDGRAYQGQRRSKRHGYSKRSLPPRRADGRFKRVGSRKVKR